MIALIMLAIGAVGMCVTAWLIMGEKNKRDEKAERERLQQCLLGSIKIMNLDKWEDE